MSDGTAFAAGKIREIWNSIRYTPLIPIERGARRIFPAEEGERHSPRSSQSAPTSTHPAYFFP